MKYGQRQWAGGHYGCHNLQQIDCFTMHNHVDWSENEASWYLTSFCYFLINFIGRRLGHEIAPSVGHAPSTFACFMRFACEMLVM